MTTQPIDQKEESKTTTIGGDEKTQEHVDEKLYSRQLYVMGIEAMKQMQNSKVLIVGMNGVGVEIAKNVILAGVKVVSILDETPVSLNDLSSQFYLKESDVKAGRTRASACVNQLQELNRYVTVTDIGKPLSENLLREGQFQVVILVNHPLATQIKYGNLCRELNIKFIATEGLGVFGYVFVDLGKEFIVQDDNGEQAFSGMITHISKGNPGVVRVHEDQRHGLETGDWVRFEEVQGMTQLNNAEPMQVKVLTPFTFEICSTQDFNEYTGEGWYFQAKKPKLMKFETLEEQLKKPSFLASDFTKDPAQRHIFYQALCAFREANGRLPHPTSSEDAHKVVQRAKEIEKAEEGKSTLDEKVLFGMARCSSAVINPMAAFLGGVVGQEILKACTGKFTPIHQILYFDAAEALPSPDVPLTQYAPQKCRYDDNIAVFGKDVQDKVLDAKMFLVGAGAIGCEMLKNWALMGVGCGEQGRIWVTDMDTIETSNLNRQFLFRTKDVGLPKSTTAAEAAKGMNDQMKIVAHQNRVGEQSENVYNDFFWFNLTAVCTALDNVQARLYVDAQCVNHKKPLLESGTLGTKGNTQIVVPSLTESYGSTRDPPEKDIPICTLKNFPNKIEHTIQWARDDFEGVFKSAPQEVNRYISEDKYLDNLAKDNSNELLTLQNLNDYLTTEKPTKFEDCVRWSRLKFEKEYNHRINQLLHNFPKDSMTNEGVPFWSGPKRAPEVLIFDEKDDTHLQYITAASNLRAQLYGIKGTTDRSIIENILKQIKDVPVFQPKKVKIAATDEEAKEMKNKEEVGDDYTEQTERLKKILPKRSDLQGFQIYPIEFEKDDDTNFHMDYITACSNLRARNYKIKESTKHETKGIAGKIIPAIATTTALVTGLISFEFFKLVQTGKVIEDFRNAYVNLALPLFAMSEPAPCGKTTLKIKNADWSYSLWDKIEIENGKNMRLKDLMEYFQEQWGLELTMLSYGSAILYAFFHSEEKKEKRKEAKLRKIVEALTNAPIPEDKKYLLFEVGLTNPETDEDVEVPTVRVDISN